MLVRDNIVSDSYIYFEFKRKKIGFIFTKKVVVIVDGTKTMHIKCRSKRSTKYEIKPGEHNICIYIGFLSLKIGKAYVNLNLNPGEKIIVSYTPPLFSFQKGKIKTEEK